MNQSKKKARPSVGALGRAKPEAETKQATTSNYDFTTSTPQAQAKISALLLPGRENAIPRRDLESMTGLDGRTIRLMIERERRAGVPILADNATGYFLPRSEDERAAFVRSMRHRAHEILTTASVIERGICDALEGQVKFDV